MTQLINAIWDGEVFWPQEKVKLAPNTEVRLLVTGPVEKKSKKQKRAFLRCVAAMNLERPKDFSGNLEKHIEGKPLEIGKVYSAPANLPVTTARRRKAKGAKR